MTEGESPRDFGRERRALEEVCRAHGATATLAVLAMPDADFVVQAFSLEALPPAAVERLDELKRAIYRELARDHDQAEELEFPDGSELQ